MTDWTPEIIAQVWEMNQSTECTGSDDNGRFKKDLAGAWIMYEAYGNRNSEYGWEIDHIWPESKGGSDDLSNLQALHWENNLRKGDDYPEFETAKTSYESQNLHQVKSWQLYNGMILPSASVKQSW
jgi:hypothetical protein